MKINKQRLAAKIAIASALVAIVIGLFPLSMLLGQWLRDYGPSLSLALYLIVFIGVLIEVIRRYKGGK